MKPAYCKVRKRRYDSRWLRQLMKAIRGLLWKSRQSERIISETALRLSEVIARTCCNKPEREKDNFVTSSELQLFTFLL